MPPVKSASRGLGRSIGGLLAGLLTALFIVTAIPALVTALSDYRFSLQGYTEVFIHRHHDVTLWFARGWPESIVPVVILLGPLAGGLIYNGICRRSVFWIAIAFAACYSLLMLSLAALAASSHPYAFRWPEFFRFQGEQQALTLFVLAALLSGIGALIAEKRGRARTSP